MLRTYATAFRNANRLMQPPKMIKATQSIHKAITGLMIDSAFSPLTGLAPKAAKLNKKKAPTNAQALGTAMGQVGAANMRMFAFPGKSSAGKPVPRIPTGAQYCSRKHRSAWGSRSFRLYLPVSRPQKPNGLILMLHGCSQTPDDFALGTHMNALAEKHGLAIAYPMQTKRHNAGLCWNWFKPENQMRGAGEPAILASLTRKLMKEFGLGRDSVFVGGLSAGGAMAAILADVYPDIFSAAGMHSALARGAAHNVASAMSAMRNGGSQRPTLAGINGFLPVRRIIFQGDNDSTVHPSNAAMLVDAAVGIDATPTKISNQSVQGRDYTRSNFAKSNGAGPLELWMLKGAGHAWSGGRTAGSFTDRKGPDASVQMVRFFLTKSD